MTISPTHCDLGREGKSREEEGKICLHHHWWNHSLKNLIGQIHFQLQQKALLPHNQKQKCPAEFPLSKGLLVKKKPQKNNNMWFNEKEFKTILFIQPCLTITQCKMFEVFQGLNFCLEAVILNGFIGGGFPSPVLGLQDSFAKFGTKHLFSSLKLKDFVHGPLKYCVTKKKIFLESKTWD